MDGGATSHRQRLQRAAAGIARNYGKPITKPPRALSKLLVAPRWIAPGVRARGLARWKRGELIEWVTARPGQRAEEWGDVGYYVAQTWGWLWRLYAAITPAEIADSAAAKFERRANGIQ